MTVFLTLGGCASLQEDLVNASTPAGPPAWQDGYRQGCLTAASFGQVGQRLVKDFKRYDSDNLYKQGWDDGLRLCK